MSTNLTAKDRPIFVARFRALPDVDPIYSLRLMLKEENNHATPQATTTSSHP